jgi:hypothetical protein
MPGDRFSRLYIDPGTRVRDSARARNRLGVLFRHHIFKKRGLYPLAHYVEGKLGVRIDGGGLYANEWDRFIQKAELLDLLDTVTVVFEYTQSQGGASWWLASVQAIFAEENLDYVVDDACVVHPFVDQEFQANRASVLAGLEGPRYGNVRDASSAPPVNSAGETPRKRGVPSLVKAYVPRVPSANLPRGSRSARANYSTAICRRYHCPPRSYTPSELPEGMGRGITQLSSRTRARRTIAAAAGQRGFCDQRGDINIALAGRN